MASHTETYGGKRSWLFETASYVIVNFYHIVTKISTYYSFSLFVQLYQQSLKLGKFASFRVCSLCLNCTIIVILKIADMSYNNSFDHIFSPNLYYYFEDHFLISDVAINLIRRFIMQQGIVILFCFSLSWSLHTLLSKLVILHLWLLNIVMLTLLQIVWVYFQVDFFQFSLLPHY